MICLERLKMFNLDYVEFDEDIYTKLIKTSTGKPRKKTSNLFPYYKNIISNIDNYIANVPNFENTNSLFLLKNDIHNKLYKLYDSESREVKDLKKKIKDLTIKNPKTKDGLVCPYCGITRNEIYDLDHFMPRSKYPEFSILSNNLIYVCPTCNQKCKEDEFLDTSTPAIRKFLNPYYDSLNDEKIIKCDISNEGTILKINFVANPNLKTTNPYLFSVTENHINTLKLNERYKKNIMKDLLNKFLNTFKDNSITNQRKIKNFTTDEAQRYINIKINELDNNLINNFELLFWKEFLNSTNYFDSIKGQLL